MKRNVKYSRHFVDRLAQGHLFFTVKDLHQLEQVHSVESFLVLSLPSQIQGALDPLASPGPATEPHPYFAVEQERAHPQGPDIPPPLLLLVNLLREPSLVFPGQTVEEVIGADLKP